MFENITNQTNFSLERLATFCDVAGKGNIKAAAGEDGPTRQSQYSRQIKELEEFLVPGKEDLLMKRDTRPHFITEDGKEFYNICYNFLSTLETFVKKCRALPLQITIGAGDSLIQWILLPHLLPKLKKQMPKTSFIFKNERTDTILEGLKSGTIDLGLVRSNALKENQSGLKNLQTHAPQNADFEYVLWVPTKIASGLDGNLSIQKLAELPLTILEGPGEIKKQLEDRAQKNNVQLNVRVECSSSIHIKNLIETQEYCGFLPKIIQKEFLLKPPPKPFKVQGVNYKRKLCFAWNRKRFEVDPELKTAVDCIRKTLPART